MRLKVGDRITNGCTSGTVRQITDEVVRLNIDGPGSGTNSLRWDWSIPLKFIYNEPSKYIIAAQSFPEIEELFI